MKFLWRKITLYSYKLDLFQNSSDCFLSNFSFSKAFSQSSREATIEFELNYEGLTLTNFMRDLVSKHDVPYTVTNNLPNLQISKLNHVKFLSTALQLIMILNCFCQIVHQRQCVNPSSPYPTKWWRIVLSVFDHFVGLKLKATSMVLKIKTSNMSEKKPLFEAGILQNTRRGRGSHQKNLLHG